MLGHTYTRTMRQCLLKEFQQKPFSSELWDVGWAHGFVDQSYSMDSWQQANTTNLDRFERRNYTNTRQWRPGSE